MPTKGSNYHPSSSLGWPSRILLVALAGIFFLTFYPFEFTLSQLPHGSLFLLNARTLQLEPKHNFLNILLFIPFGFGLAAKLREKARSWVATTLLCCVAGTLCSYTIEFSQLFIVGRDSGWDDVLCNAL